MRAGRPEGTTRVCGLDQQFRALPVRDVQLTDPETGAVWGLGYETIWYPSQEEIDALTLRRPVKVLLIGIAPDQPVLPMKVMVGDTETVGDES